jgi:branched-chain amino acid transport system permease protein
MMLIVAFATEHMLGFARIPAFVNRIPVLIGAFTVSALSMRLIFAVAASAGVELLDYGSEQGWIYNNMENVRLVNEFLAGNPMLCIGLILFSLAAAMILGGLSGWLLARVTLRFEPIYILMATLALTDLGCVPGRSITWVSGGTLGLYVPDPLAFIPGNQHVTWALMSVALAAGVFLLLGRIESSPWGRLAAATGENPMTATSVGNDLVKIRGRVIFYTSGIMALAGTLWGFYYLFVVESPYHNWPWLFYPLAAIFIGGLGSRRGTLYGLIVFFVFLRLIIVFKFEIQQLFFFPVSYIEDVFLSLIILAALFLHPRLQRGRRRVHIEGIVDAS